MFDFWVWLTLAAVLLQTARNIAQRRLITSLGRYGASYVRFLYGVPVTLGAALIFHVSISPLPSVNLAFLVWSAAGALAQILFALTLLRLFQLRSFAIGIAFSNTEILQLALLESVVLGLIFSFHMLAALVLGVVSVVLLGLSRANITLPELLRILRSRVVIQGLLAGFWTAVASLSFRAAALALDDGNESQRALLVAVAVILLQTVCMGAYMAYRHGDEFRAALSPNRFSLLAGFSGALATIAWFTAYTLHTATAVRVLGQLEILFALAFSWLALREKISRAELSGICLLIISAVLIIYAA